MAASALPLVAPVAVTVVAAGSGLPLAFGHLPTVLPGYLVGLVLLLLGGGQEEPGWRGYLLPRLQTRISPLAASAAVGVVWAVWHLPLFVLGVDLYADRPFELYVPQLMAVAVAFTWLYNATRGSVVLAMLMHASVNQSSNLAPVAGELGPAIEDGVPRWDHRRVGRGRGSAGRTLRPPTPRTPTRRAGHERQRRRRGGTPATADGT